MENDRDDLRMVFKMFENNGKIEISDLNKISKELEILGQEEKSMAKVLNF